MSAQHTPGHITVKRWQFGSSVFVLYGSDDFPIAQTVGNSSPEGMERARRGEHEANARRLVACWNACDGISTEALEMGAIQDRIASACGELYLVKAQRDALLEALQVARGWMRSGECNCYQAADPDKFKADEAMVDSAISKATGQKGSYE